MQAWALNSTNPTARLNKQKQNRSRTSASNHAFDSKLHYRVCSWTGTAIACPVSAEEKAPQQAGYAAMNGFLPAGHASPAPMSAPVPVTRDAAPQLQQASASIDGCIVAAGYANSWYSNYQRNNKRSGIKNLRCFPLCTSSTVTVSPPRLSARTAASRRSAATSAPLKPSHASPAHKASIAS